MTGILFFLGSMLLLVLGYFLYGRLAQKIYGVDLNMKMPCVTDADGVDFVPMPVWKIFLIQLLNIAGLGPVFGALAGCLFGPVSLLWIVLGGILAGAMHDFLAAVLSAEHRGENLSELTGRYLGNWARVSMRTVCIVLLLLVGVTFTLGPAGMLNALMSDVSLTWWCVIILLYYFLATILPINAIIGRIYPIFGALFIFMAISMLIALPFSEYEILPSLNVLENQHPAQIGIWPAIFVTIACGAISGFHATQSPLMVRCLQSMHHARGVFYGAMIMESMVALIWAVVGLTVREVIVSADGMSFMQLSMKSPAVAVNSACQLLLGPVGAWLAVLGVVILPITSGDTALRSCRLIIADIFRMRQDKIRLRLLIAVPLFLAVIIVSQIEFSIIWRYFGWANQTLSCFTLWTLAVVMRLRGRFHWIATVPALFMSTMCVTFLLHIKDCGICMPLLYATGAGCLFSLALLGIFFRCVRRKDSQEEAA